jgi:signal transduction histidine kinase
VEANRCVSGLSLQVRDISERKRIGHRLRERDARLEDADRRKDEFLALLAHELRNRLAPLTNVLRLLERSTVLGAPELALVAIAGRLEERGQRVEVDLSKYTPQGGRIRVSVTEAPAEVAIAIADDGIGIEPENPALLFEPFRQLDSSVDRSAGGLGIGLTLVRRQAELHGGSAVAASEGLGRGACFTVRLPRVAAAAH